MADNNGASTLDNPHRLLTVKPTTRGVPQKDLSLTVSKPARKILAQLDSSGNVKVPRKRATSESWKQDYPWMEELEAPRILYFFVPDDNTQIPVEFDEESELYVDADGNKYTHENVVEAADPDFRELTGTPDALNKLQAAISAFNKATGKRLITRFVSAKRDKAQRTIEQTTAVIRTV